MRIIKAGKGNINTRHGDTIGRPAPHIGIDIGWGEGYEIYAPADGYLEHSWYGSYGNRAIITHPDGTWSLLAHAAEYFVNKVQVKQGDHIGTMGRTGGPWGTAGWYVHLHQEYHLADGTAVDPEQYMEENMLDATDHKWLNGMGQSIIDRLAGHINLKIAAVQADVNYIHQQSPYSLKAIREAQENGSEIELTAEQVEQLSNSFVGYITDNLETAFRENQDAVIAAMAQLPDKVRLSIKEAL